jgi:EAL domain
VKIDASFISRLLDSADDEVIVQSIVDLVRALDIDSVAEGVESAKVAAALRVMGCKAAQGWHFSKPLNAASATAWLAEHGVAGVQPTPLSPAHPPSAHPPSAHRAPGHRAPGHRASGLPPPSPATPPAGLPS